MKMLMNVNPIRYFLLVGLASFLLFSQFSCSDDDGVKSYDPSKPIVLTTFYPDSGGIQDYVMLKGENFGSDPNQIRVWFNSKQAYVTGASGNEILALVPRLPGDTCTISVVIGGDSVVYKNQSYHYFTNYNLSVLCGQPGSNSNYFEEGALNETHFNGNLHFLTIDPEDIIYVSMKGETDRGPVAYVHEKENYTKWLFNAESYTNSPMGGCFEPEAQVILIPSHNSDYFWEIDPYDSWSYALRQLSHPTAEQIATGEYKDFTLNWNYSFTYRPSDGYIYIRSYAGHLVKFKLEGNRLGTLVATSPYNNTDTYIGFDPYDDTKIYCSILQRHCLSVIDLTKDPSDPDFETIVIGVGGGTGGHLDGHSSMAQFKSPYQFQITKDLETGNKIMYIADSGNNCIRKYDFETEMVTTIAGSPGVSGLSTGSPLKSLIAQPVGLVVNSEGNLIISDKTNRVLYKLAFE